MTVIASLYRTSFEWVVWFRILLSPSPPAELNCGVQPFLWKRKINTQILKEPEGVKSTEGRVSYGCLARMVFYQLINTWMSMVT